jgi:hypothetical protein
MRRLATAVLIAALAAIHITAVGILDEQHAALRHTDADDAESLFVLPAPILNVVSLEYKGIVSDMLFLKGIVFIGGLLSRDTDHVLSDRLPRSQWREFYHLMDVSTDLDPYFQDPYYLANAILPWEAGLISETNTLLAKGSRARFWDWSLPFFIGFNYYYFLGENENAAAYLMVASKRPGASLTLASLASKLAFKAHQTENSILFLEEMIQKTDDEYMKKEFMARVEAFRSILVLEHAVSAFHRKLRRDPTNLVELVEKKFLRGIPLDPYGGTFYLDKEGNVRTTSEKRLMPVLKK